MAGYLLAAALLLCMQGWSSGVERGQVVLLPSSTSNGMSYVQVYERSSCKRREVLVNVLKEHPQETAHFFKPSCVLLQRCTGCCNDDSLKCFAVTKRSIRLQIIRVSNTQTLQTEWMDFTEHLSCECRPRRVNSAKNRKSRKRKRCPLRFSPRAHPEPPPLRVPTDRPGQSRDGARGKASRRRQRRAGSSAAARAGEAAAHLGGRALPREAARTAAPRGQRAYLRAGRGSPAAAGRSAAAASLAEPERPAGGSGAAEGPGKRGRRSLRPSERCQLPVWKPKSLIMANQDLASTQELLDLTFQSLACKHMDLKQMELDTAAAKVDELSKQLESLWTDHPGPPVLPSLMADRYSSISSPDLLKMDVRAASPLHLRKSPTWDLAEPSGPPSLSPYSSSPSQLLAPKPTLGRPSSPRPSFFLQSDVDWSPTAPSRPKVMAVPYEGLPGPGAHGGSPRSLRPAGLPERQFDYRPFAATGGWGGRAGSPRLPGESSMSQAFFPERGPSPRPPLPPPYENHSLYPSAPGSFWAQDDLLMRRRAPKSWNESDLDVAYEKKAPHPVGYERVDPHAGLRQNTAGLPLTPWKESSLDGGWPGKEEHYGMSSATLPRNYKVSALAGERRPDISFRRSLAANQAGTLPRNWQPISRIPIPPPAPQGGSLPRRHKPLPLSMIFRLQNAFWESGAAGGKLGLPPGAVGSPLALRSLQKLLLQQPVAPAQPPLWTVQSGSEGNASPRATAMPAERMVPIVLTPSEAEPELESLLPGTEPAEMDNLARPLSPTRLQPVLPPEAQKVPEFEEVARVLAEMPRPLKRRGSMEQNPSPALLPPHKKQYQQIISRLFHHQPRKEEAVPVGDPSSQPDLSPITEAAEQKGPPATPTTSPAMTPPPAPDSPASLSPMPSPEKRSVLRKVSSPRKRTTKKARLNPLVLLLDTALTGELEVVKEAVKELNDPSQPNDEGITALHNAICGANYSIVDFLINIGANVNSPDSHGWTPLHCAASCNDTAICIALVKHGAAIFATTFSDGSLAIEKCDPYREGYNECFSYLADVEQNMGLMNNGVVYALWDYSAEFSDELSFREGEPVTVLRRDGQEELDWWWASLYGQEGYVPKNYFGLFPRVRPQQQKT